MKNSRKSKRGWKSRFSSKKSAKWFDKRVVPISGGELLYTQQIDQDTQMVFTSNHVKSSKYTIFNFWFLNLYEQFRRVANFYFLIVAVIQLALPSSPVSPGTSVFPLIFVVVVTMIKQGYEDFCRHRSDRELNKTPVNILRNGQIVPATSQEIRVGDIVSVKNNDKFPADLVLLATSSQAGKCFVMTANLDGETNLKPLSAAQLTKHCQTPHDLAEIKGQIECENPNPDLHNFNGRMKLQRGEEMEVCSLSLDNLVMRGTQLRNTDHVYGCAVYTGKDTKMSQNSKSTGNKFSTVEITMNKYLMVFMALLILEIVMSTSLRYTWGVDAPDSHLANDNHWYLGGDIPIEVNIVLQDFFSFLVLYNYIIPISLYVTLEFQKFVGSMFLVWDIDLYDAEVDEPAKCNSSDLNEELGQIEILFSDKTGTLTENIMLFKEASISGRQYKVDELLVKPVGNYSAFTNDRAANYSTLSNHSNGRIEKDSLLDESFVDPQGGLQISEFLSAISICHTVQTAKKFKGVDSLKNGGKAKKRHKKLVPSGHKGTTNGGFHALRKKMNNSRSNLAEPPHAVDDAASSCGEGSVSSLASSTLYNNTNNGMANMGYTSEGADESSMISDVANIEYTASSPDEKALVEACKRFGITFLGVDDDGYQAKLMLLESRTGNPTLRTYTRLHVLDFDSTRKRMSVIVRSPEGQVKLITKGAESSVLPRCVGGPKHETGLHIDEYALVGLRTLAIGSRIISDQELASFQAQLAEAQQALEGREAKIQAIYTEVEKGLTLLGATAVEDKLQFGVKETLVSLGEAGVSVWILTGDKKETAINISYACGHLLPGVTVIDITGIISTELTPKLEAALEQVNKSPDDKFGLVVDGSVIALIMPVEENKQLLFQISSKCQAVVCCRMSPLQKSEIVRMMKTSPLKPVTAAIGDGGNDVAMIQEAHIGLGIMGKEGRAAVRAADFAFSKFYYLKKVMLVHGHWYYYRVSILVQYFFYKNVACFTCQQYYAFFNSFSGQTLFDSVDLTLYNITFTSLPIFLLALFEQNIDKSTLMKKSFLYARNYRNKMLTWREFVAWLLQALWHSSVVYFGWYLYFTYSTSQGGLTMDTTTVNGGLDRCAFGYCVYGTIIALVNLRLLYQSRWWTWFLVCSIIFSILFFMAVTFVTNAVSFFDDDIYWVYYNLLQEPGVWLYTLLLLVLALVPDVVLRVVRKHWFAIKNGLGHSRCRRESHDEVDNRVRRGQYELNQFYDNVAFTSQPELISAARKEHLTKC